MEAVMAAVIKAGYKDAHALYFKQGRQKVREALQKKGIEMEHIQKFFNDLYDASSDFIKEYKAVEAAVREELKGKDLLLELDRRGAKKLAKAYARVIIKPQALFQMSKISVETNLVGKKIELAIIFDGEEHVIVSTAP
jgi:hypothetical protein